ncbi:MAG: hypothetical protein WB987_03730 [Candidatus Acidiferrales bacterium]
MSCVKNLSSYIVGLVLLFALSPVARGAKEQVFKGVIADSQCAMNVHSLSQSHKEMLQGKSVGTTEADCVWYCVTERGGRFVLQNKSRIYKLDKQDLGREFAGRKVRIAGTLDSETNTIHVRTITLVDEPSKPPAPAK